MPASLPMYAHPRLEEAHQTFWSLILDGMKQHNLEAPQQLSPEGMGTDFWTGPDLILSQTCGYPYKTRLVGKVQLVGTPDYGLEGCPPGYYCSHFVAHRKLAGSSVAELTNHVFAYNSRDSQSGFNAARQHLSNGGSWFQQMIETGSHRASVLAVAEGAADIAAIDAVSWRLMERYDDFTEDLIVLESTLPTPGLPYITALRFESDRIANIVRNAISALPDPVKDALMIKELVDIPREDYLAVPG